MKAGGMGTWFEATRRSLVVVVGAAVLVVAVAGFAMARSGGFLTAATVTTQAQPTGTGQQAAVRQATASTQVTGQDGEVAEAPEPGEAAGAPEAKETTEPAEPGEAADAPEASEAPDKEAPDSDQKTVDSEHDSGD